MPRPLFTPEELEAMRLADEEIDAEFEDAGAAYSADQMDLDRDLDGEAADLTRGEAEARRLRKRREWYARNKDRVNAKKRAAWGERQAAASERAKAWRAANKEHLQGMHRNWYLTNREEILAARRAYHIENRERNVEKSRQWYAENHERALARQAAYREAHREEIHARQAAYREAHREEINAKRRAKHRADVLASRLTVSFPVGTGIAVVLIARPAAK